MIKAFAIADAFSFVKKMIDFHMLNKLRESLLYVPAYLSGLNGCFSVFVLVFVVWHILL